GWTLPYMMGVQAEVVAAPFSANLVKVDTVVPAPGRIEGTGDVFVLHNRTNAESRAIAALLTAGQSLTITGDSVIVRGPRARAILAEQAARGGFSVTALQTEPVSSGVTRQRFPRIALYQPWTA